MTLFENSTSFFTESIAKAVEAESVEREWKFALLLLVQAIETCLKERLKRENDVFIFTDIDKPKHTVNIRLALDRLQKIAKLNISQKDVDSIKFASELRNQIVHFEFDMSIDQIKSNFTRLIGFYTSFCQEHLNVEMAHYIPENLNQEILKLETYVFELLRRAEERIEKEDINEEYIWECPACGQFTFVIYDGIDCCYLCNYKQTVGECDWCNELAYEDDLNEIYTGNYKRQDSYEYICRECYEKATNENPYGHDY